jgi:hypothetical protein
MMKSEPCKVIHMAVDNSKSVDKFFINLIVIER